VAVAYTGLLKRHVILAAYPPEEFLERLHAVLIECGWEWLGEYGLTGNEYLITSPQSLSARVRIWYPGTAEGYSNCFALQVMSTFNEFDAGFVHRFIAGYSVEGNPHNFSEYSVWVNKCQIFIGARTEVVYTQDFPKAVSAGVPYAMGVTAPTPLCQYQGAPPAATTVELWWSCGDDNGVGMHVFPETTQQNFRSSYFCQRYSFCWNGELANEKIGNPTLPVEAKTLQLAIMRASPYWNALGTEWPEGFVRPDDTALAYDPLIIHGTKIYGSLWDCTLLTRPMELEEEETIFDTQGGVFGDWVNYTKSSPIFISTFQSRNEGQCYSLMLLKTDLAFPEVNVAY
jgi:hypothetical protein